MKKIRGVSQIKMPTSSPIFLVECYHAHTNLFPFNKLEKAQHEICKGKNCIIYEENRVCLELNWNISLSMWRLTP